jgi:hypothetical protein
VSIKQFLKDVRAFTDYIEELAGDIKEYGGQAQTKWDYILGVYGPTPVLCVRGSMNRIFDSLQAVTVGWEEAHDLTLWHVLPKRAEVMDACGLSAKAYDKIDHAISLVVPWNKQLRCDLIAACGMEDETQSNWFKETYETYLERHRRLVTCRNSEDVE